MVKGIKNKTYRTAIEKKLETLNKIIESFKNIGSPDDIYLYVEISQKYLGFIDEINEEYKCYQRGIHDTVDRAMDIWGLEYAEYSHGLYPSGNQIGRRNIMPEDVGLTTWKHKAHPSWKSQRVPFIDCIMDENAFLLLTGMAYKPPENAQPLKGVSEALSGVMLPFNPTSTEWREIDGYYIQIFKCPVVLSPQSRLVINLFEDPHGYEFELELLGNIIGKREYLVKEPRDIMVRSYLNNP